MSVSEVLMLVIGAILVTNVVFQMFLGICPYLGVSKQLDSALGMGMAVAFVMTLAVAVTWPLQYYILEPLGLGYLKTIAFILIIASLVQFVEIALKRVARGLYEALGIYLPLITTNCAILGVALLAIQNEYNYPVSLAYAFASAAGFTLAIVIFAGVRERLELMDVPKVLAGAPIALVVAGIIAMAFMGFTGLGK